MKFYVIQHETINGWEDLLPRTQFPLEDGAWMETGRLADAYPRFSFRLVCREETVIREIKAGE